jgi:hypothetical protein
MSRSNFLTPVGGFFQRRTTATTTAKATSKAKKPSAKKFASRRYPEDRLAFADVLEAERIERRDAAVIELQDRYGIESRISSDGRTVGFKEGSS